DRQGWPLWYGDLAQFFRGARLLFSGDEEAAANYLTAYARNERTEPAWAYAFRPVALQWIDAVEKWESTRRDALARANAGNASAAQAVVEGFAKTAPSFLVA